MEQSRTERYKEYRKSIQESGDDVSLTAVKKEDLPTDDKEVEILRKINRQKKIVTTIYVAVIMTIGLGLIIAGVIVFIKSR